MSTKQIFLYMERAGLNQNDIKALREAGFVPIKVKSFHDVRIIDPLLVGNSNVVWQAAIEAIRVVGTKEAEGEGAKTLFGRKLTDRLCKLIDSTDIPKPLEES